MAHIIIIWIPIVLHFSIVYAELSQILYRLFIKYNTYYESVYRLESIFTITSFVNTF